MLHHTSSLRHHKAKQATSRIPTVLDNSAGLCRDLRIGGQKSVGRSCSKGKRGRETIFFPGEDHPRPPDGKLVGQNKNRAVIDGAGEIDPRFDRGFHSPLLLSFRSERKLILFGTYNIKSLK